MPRHRVHVTNADRQAAYRDRLKGKVTGVTKRLGAREQLENYMPEPQPVTVTKKKQAAKVSPGWQPGRVTKAAKAHVLSHTNISTAIKWTYCGKRMTATEDGSRYLLVKQVPNERGKGWHYEQTNVEVRTVTEKPTCKTCANHPDYSNAVFVERYKAKQRNRAVENLQRAQELGIVEKPEPVAFSKDQFDKHGCFISPKEEGTNA